MCRMKAHAIQIDELLEGHVSGLRRPLTGPPEAH